MFEKGIKSIHLVCLVDVLLVRHFDTWQVVFLLWLFSNFLLCLFLSFSTGEAAHHAAAKDADCNHPDDGVQDVEPDVRFVSSQRNWATGCMANSGDGIARVGAIDAVDPGFSLPSDCRIAVDLCGERVGAATCAWLFRAPFERNPISGHTVAKDFVGLRWCRLAARQDLLSAVS